MKNRQNSNNSFTLTNYCYFCIFFETCKTLSGTAKILSVPLKNILFIVSSMLKF
jgi:hypothetical protein